MISWLFEIGTLRLSTKPVTHDGVSYAAAVVPETFSGIEMRHDLSGSGLIAPSDVRFDVVGPYTVDQFEGQHCLMRLVIDGLEAGDGWKVKIKTAVAWYGKISCSCVDLLSDHLDGDWPSNPAPKEVWPSDDDDTSAGTYCIPVVLGSAFIPLRSVNTGSARHYVLGKEGTYVVDEVRSPHDWGNKSAWLASEYTMSQSADSGYSLLQPKIDEQVDPPGTGLWPDGSGFMDMPCRFSNSATVSTTNPSDWIRFVLESFGVASGDIDSSSFNQAALSYDADGIEFHGGWWKKEGREKILSNLLAQVDSFLVCTDKIYLHRFSKTSLTTVDNVALQSFRPERITTHVHDSGAVHWPEAIEKPQDILAGQTIVPAYGSGATGSPDGGVLEARHLAGQSVSAQKAGILYWQKRLMQARKVSFSVPYSMVSGPYTLVPGKVITISGSMYGGTFDIVVTVLAIDHSLETRITGVMLSHLEDWGDLSPAPVVVAEDDTPGFPLPWEAAVDAFGFYADNFFMGVTTETDGTGGVFGGENVSSAINVYKNNVIDNSGWVFDYEPQTFDAGGVPANKFTAEIDQEAPSITITGMHDLVDRVYITVTATHEEHGALSTHISVTKFKRGQPGATLTSYWLEHPDVFRMSDAGEYYPENFTFSAYSKAGDADRQAFAGTFLIEEYYSGAYHEKYVSPDPETSTVYIPSAGTSVTNVRCSLKVPATGFVLDMAVINVVRDGSSGLTVSLSNSAHTVPASSTGVVAGYSGSGTAITVFEGAVQAGFGTVARPKFSIGSVTVSPEGGITVGSISGAGTETCTVGPHSAMAQAVDTVTITYRLSITRADGTVSQIDAVQTITKSREGTPGEDGEPGAPGPPGEDGTDGVDASNWSSTVAFSSAGAAHVAWSAGYIYSTYGAYSVSAGSYSSLTSTTRYIYFDGSSTLKTTTTASTAVGVGKLLLAVARAGAGPSQAFFQAFGGAGGVIVGADQIAANSITANLLAASLIYTGEIRDAESNLKINFSTATITVRKASGLVISTAGGLEVTAGGHILLDGGGTNPGGLLFKGSSGESGIGASSSGRLLAFWPQNFGSNLTTFAVGYSISSAGNTAQAPYSAVSLNANNTISLFCGPEGDNRFLVINPSGLVAKGNITPNQSDVYALGSADYKFSAVHAAAFYGDGSNLTGIGGGGTTYLAGNGLTLSGSTFALGTPGSLSTSTSNNVTTSSHTHAVTFPFIGSGSGMNFTGGSTGVTVSMGTPGTISSSSTNSVSSSSHTHAISGFPVLGTASNQAHRGDHGSAAYMHVSSTGMDHTYIGQALLTNSNPTFASINAATHYISSWNLRQTSGNLIAAYGSNNKLLLNSSNGNLVITGSFLANQSLSIDTGLHDIWDLFLSMHSAFKAHDPDLLHEQLRHTVYHEDEYGMTGEYTRHIDIKDFVQVLTECLFEVEQRLAAVEEVT